MSIGHWRAVLPALMLLAAWLVLAMPASVLAQVPTVPQVPGVSPTPIPIACEQYVGLTNHIAGCIRHTLDNSTDAFFSGMYPIFSRAITALMTLAVIIVGVMGAFGMLEKIGRDTIMLLMKVAFVTYFAANSDYMYGTIRDSMDSVSSTVLTFVPASGPLDNSGTDFSQVACIRRLNETQGIIDGQPGVSSPWIAMDCLIDSVIGIKVANANPAADLSGGVKKAFNDTFNNNEFGPSRGLLYLFFSAMQTSVLGIIIAVIGLIFLWGIINLIIKALFIYLAGYLGLAVLMIVAPLFVPLVLFQVTRSYFDKWVKLMIGFALQPVIILVFITFTIAAVDLATFSGNYSVMYRIAGNASRQQGFSLNNYLTTVRADGHAIVEDSAVEVGRVKADVLDNIPVVGGGGNSIFSGIETSECTKALMDADPAVKERCSQSYGLNMFRTSINWDRLAAARSPSVSVPAAVPGEETPTPGSQIAKEVLAAIIFAAVVVFVMNQLLEVIPMIANDILGDFGMSPNLANVAMKGGLPGLKAGGKGGG